MGVRSVVVFTRELDGAVSLQHRDTTAALGPGNPHRVLHRPPLAREVGDRDPARAALVHAPDDVARLDDRKKRGGGWRRRHFAPFTCSSLWTEFTPPTLRAVASARRFVSSESTRPLSVT